MKGINPLVTKRVILGLSTTWFSYRKRKKLVRTVISSQQCQH